MVHHGASQPIADGSDILHCTKMSSGRFLRRKSMAYGLLTIWQWPCPSLSGRVFYDGRAGALSAPHWPARGKRYWTDGSPWNDTTCPKIAAFRPLLTKAGVTKRTQESSACGRAL